MDKNINIKTKKLEFEVYEDEQWAICEKTVELKIFDDVKTFTACEEAICSKGNVFNVSFGKALAEIRCNRTISNQMEIAMIKYSFDHFLEKPKADEILVDGFQAIMELLGSSF
jgi:hypothetical protein